MRSEKDAGAMVDAMRFIASMIGSGNNQKQAAALADVLDTMTLSSEGNVFKMSLTIPEDQLERLLHPARMQARIRVH